MLEHELTPEQQQVADDLLLAFNALLKTGMPSKEVAHIIVPIALEAEETLVS